MTNPFTDFKFSPHSVGNLMTCLPGLTDVQVNKLDKLLQRKIDSESNPKLKLTEIMQAELSELLEKEDCKETPDTLPKGVKTELNKIYNAVVWKRKRIVEDDEMLKGRLQEQDGLELVSSVDGIFYKKNIGQIENDWLIGTPDVWPDVKDIKCPWDLDTFDAAELSSLYEWQIRAYVWITGGADADMWEVTSGELIYTLVNAPAHMVVSEIGRIQYRYGVDPSSEKWLKIAQQIERNLIFDVEKFKEDNPLYTFVNDDLDFSIPEHFRIRRFTVTLTSDDIKAFQTRLPICRKYLIEKFQRDFANTPIVELNEVG